MYILMWSFSNLSSSFSRINNFFILSYNIFSLTIMIINHFLFQSFFIHFNSILNLLLCIFFIWYWLKLLLYSWFRLSFLVRSHEFFETFIFSWNFLIMSFNIWIINRWSMRNKLTFWLNHMNYLFSKFLLNI
jgi:hypothetical protein